MVYSEQIQSSNSDYAGNSYNRNNGYDQRKLQCITDNRETIDRDPRTES